MTRYRTTHDGTPYRAAVDVSTYLDLPPSSVRRVAIRIARLTDPYSRTMEHSDSAINAKTSTGGASVPAIMQQGPDQVRQLQQTHNSRSPST